MAVEKLAYSVPESAKLIGISRAKLYEEIAAGTGPRVVKIGRRTLITIAALNEWLRSREQTGRLNPTCKS
jgi:excisionase family DNA binding protein